MNDKKFELRQRQSRSLDNSRGANSQNPIRDSFVPLSPSRARSLSPHKNIARQSVHINMDLTEYQIDRLTDAFSSHVSSPSKDRASTADRPISVVAKSTMPEAVYRVKYTRDTPDSRVHLSKGLESLEEITNGRGLCADIRDDIRHKRQSMTDISAGEEYELRYHSKESPGAKTLAQRRNQVTPDNIEIEDSRKYGTYRAGTVPAPSHPLRQSSLNALSLNGEMSSLYSQDAPHPTPQKGVAYLRGDTMSQKIENVMQTYDEWASPGQSAPIGGEPSRMSPGRQTLQSHDPRLCRRADGTERAGTAQVPEAKITTYSPLMTYFAFEGVPFQKVGGKTMIGNQGWLERPVAGDANLADQQKKDLSPKKFGLLDSIKKMAKDMTESKNSRRPREPEKVPKRLRIVISLNPREQSLLYCELEFHVNNALHAYITSELNHGRLDPNKLKKIADGWAQKGRPKVIGFRYDVETQLHLVDLHIEDFRFFGRRQGNPSEIAGLLHAMKVNARAMRVRTYCQPDSVIAKQLVDSQSLFNTVGCSEGQQIALAEIAQFFKVIVERERHYRDHLHRAGRRANAGAHEQEEHPGRRWEPQLGDDLIPEGTFDVYGSLTGTEEHHEQWQGRPE